MGRIQVLPDVLAHQIAAGEIVERPASLVKELLENAIDASATRIIVEVEDGGRRQVRLRDDGIGMGPEDARRAFEHHATSKIASLEDLEQVLTLGFRGEALPSIASVSRLRLKTVERGPAGNGAPVGTELEFAGGRLTAAREVAWPAGTEVTVEDLFFNLPARRKFLKSPTTELGHISRQITTYALACPAVEFHFSHQGRVLLEAPAVSGLRERAFQLLGESFLDNLVPLEYEKAGLRIHGYVSLPHEQRSNANSLYLYVNRRMVRDRVLTHAIRLAYQDLIPASAYPVVLLFLELDPRAVDVNVHPSKTEVRFRDSQAVHSGIYHAIEQALLLRQPGLSGLARDFVPSGLKDGPAAAGFQSGRIVSSIDRFLQRSNHPAFPFPVAGAPPAGIAAAGSARELERPYAHDGEIPRTDHLSPAPVILGQFVESFLVAADREGVFLIDQHVAHERILYDQALRALASADGPKVQRLLEPVTVELGVQQRVYLEPLIEQLNAQGFEVEWFGGGSLAFKGTPALAGSFDVGRMLADLLEELEAEGGVSGGSLNRLRETIAISLSCRAAIKINTPLAREKMQWLLDELFRCENPYTCPHGRPIVLRIHIEEILRAFKRM